MSEDINISKILHFPIIKYLPNSILANLTMVNKQFKEKCLDEFCARIRNNTIFLEYDGEWKKKVYTEVQKAENFRKFRSLLMFVDGLLKTSMLSQKDVLKFREEIRVDAKYVHFYLIKDSGLVIKHLKSTIFWGVGCLSNETEHTFKLLLFLLQQALMFSLRKNSYGNYDTFFGKFVDWRINYSLMEKHCHFSYYITEVIIKPLLGKEKDEKISVLMQHERRILQEMYSLILHLSITYLPLPKIIDHVIVNIDAEYLFEPLLKVTQGGIDELSAIQTFPTKYLDFVRNHEQLPEYIRKFLEKPIC